MKLVKSSILNTTPEKIFLQLQKPSRLQEVASPILRFEFVNVKKLPKNWKIGKKYILNLYLFMHLYVGKHSIIIKKIDYKKKQIFSDESGLLAKIWNHKIYVNKYTNNKTHYTDEVEIHAGILTLFVWIFAYFFYSHRQKKWKKLAEQL
ncbi:MAG: hypothetical protein ABFQ65_00575 [Nanoarchaeota archaeon]